MKILLSILSGIFLIVGFIPYILSIRRLETKPAKASWIIWATLDTITFAGMLAEGAINGQITAAVIGIWIIVAHALKYGESGWTRLDKFCLSGAALGIVLWATFDSPLLGVMTSSSVVFLGSIPTFTNAWKDPSKENRTAWTVFWVSCVLVIFAIPNLAFIHVLNPLAVFTDLKLIDVVQPITFFAVETIMMYLLWIRPRFIR